MGSENIWCNEASGGSRLERWKSCFHLIVRIGSIVPIGPKKLQALEITRTILWKLDSNSRVSVSVKRISCVSWISAFHPCVFLEYVNVHGTHLFRCGNFLFTLRALATFSRCELARWKLACAGPVLSCAYFTFMHLFHRLKTGLCSNPSTAWNQLNYYQNKNSCSWNSLVLEMPTGSLTPAFGQNI